MRAPSNSDVDFLVSHAQKKSVENHPISLPCPAHFLRLKRPFVNTHTRNTHNKLKSKGLQIIVWHLWQQKHKNSCNTRIRVRAWERVDIGIFTFRNPSFWFAFHAVVSSHQNVHRKQHVILWKTTRHFEENNTSFYEKQALVLSKTTRRFLGKVS